MLNFPSDLMAKVKQSLQTLGNQSQPKFKIAVSRAKTTVTDSDYWTVETIREKANLGDISVAPRRFSKNYGGPDRLYEIHVDNGEVLTSLREYPDKLKQGWQPQFSLGTGSAVAIAFDGEWEIYRKVWRLKTHEKPWIFWIDSTGVLWAQLWDDVETKVELASGVQGSSGVKAIRGWDNINLTAQDQGIVVTYIKAGRPYYRTYAYQEDGLRIWEIEREIVDFVGTAVRTGLFITNDYRLGILVEDSTGSVTWLVTPRNWAGMAIIPERIAVSAKAEVDFIPVTYHHVYDDEQLTVAAIASVSMLFGRTDNSIISAMNVPVQRVNDELETYDDWGFKIEVILNFPTETTPTIILKDATTLSVFTLKPVSLINSTTIEILIDDTVHEFGINNVEGDLSITITDIKNEADLFYDVINDEFTPINLVPPFIPLPEVEVIWNE